MSKLTFFKDYNNYYNRIVKNNKKEVLINHLQHSFENMNFNPNNDIETEHVINWTQSWIPDYMILDLSENVRPANWTDYMTGFYLAQYSSSPYNPEISGTNEEVKEALSDYLMADDKIINMDGIMDDYAAEDYHYFQFGIEFTNMPVSALNMKLSNAGDITWYANVSVGFYPSGYVTFRSCDITDNVINYDFLKDKYPGLTEDTKITYIQFDPFDQFDPSADDMYYPSQLISLDGSTSTGENTYKSSWFVVDMERTRKDQYKVKLKRDIVSDYYDKILTSPMIIDRAMINDTSNALLYNPEGFNFNQIKTDEILLKDNSATPWYTLYFKKGIENKSSTLTPAGYDYDEVLTTSIQNSIFGTGNTYYGTEGMDFITSYRVEAGGWAAMFVSDRYDMHVKSNGVTFPYHSRSAETEVIWFVWDQEHVQPELASKFNGQYTVIKDKLTTDLGYSNAVPDTDIDKLSWDGKVVKDSDNKLWKVHVIKSTSTVSGEITAGTAVDYVKALINATGLERNGDWGDRAFNYSMSINTYTFSYEAYTSANTLSWSIDWSSQAETLDSDYNIITFPYESKVIDTGTNRNVPGTYSRALLDSIFAKFSENELVDVQLLPYCPLQNVIKANGDINLSGLDSKLYVADTNHLDTIFMLFVERANFTFNLNHQINVSSDAIERKIENETTLYRLVSPNYQGIFEFSPAKNNGVDLFNVDVTLKPYNPYIHINPNFKALYGNDYNDARGLICGGDFSIPKWSSAWVEYELRNKNYQLAFDRQIEHLDFTQGQERTLAGWNIASGAIGGTAMGALAGSKLGTAGAIAGAAIGGVSSLAGGITDYAMMKDRQIEEKDYMFDNFRFQLGNIKALPNTVNKVTPLTYNNKLYPFIEIYNASEQEVELFRNYLTYRSMKIDSIDYITNYIQTNRTFIQATPIRLENIDLTAYELAELFNEFKKGVYI